MRSFDIHQSESILTAYRDSIAKLGIDEKVNLISELTVKGKRSVKDREIARNRSTSVAYYDVPAEMDNFYDRGTYIGDDIHQLMKNMNELFYIRPPSDLYSYEETMEYKHKLPLLVINYKPVDLSDPVNFIFEYFKYKSIRVNTIKSIYINETISAICEYCIMPSHLQTSCLEKALKYSCVVFIETDEKNSGKDAKGIRKTWLEGYSGVSEFYSPNYIELPPFEPDYRRTLYWNPSVTTDENGKAKIEFFNNSRCKNFSISAETVTEDGVIGIYKDE